MRDSRAGMTDSSWSRYWDLLRSNDLFSRSTSHPEGKLEGQNTSPVGQTLTGRLLGQDKWLVGQTLDWSDKHLTGRTSTWLGRQAHDWADKHMTGRTSTWLVGQAPDWSVMTLDWSVKNLHRSTGSLLSQITQPFLAICHFYCHVIIFKFWG